MPAPRDLAPADLLAAAQRRDPARPFLTWYDLATGARVELSVVTFATWVAKTCGLLVDDLYVQPADTVAVDLPAHWLGPVWVQSVWTVGAHLALGPGPDPDPDLRPEPGPARVLVRDAEEPAEPGPPGSDLVVVRTAALGGPAGALTPAGALDYGRDVPGQPDRFVPPVPAHGDLLPATLVSQARTRAQARGPGARVLVPAQRLDREVVLDALLVPLLTDGSAVLVRGEGRPDALAPIAQAERVDLTTGRS